MTKRDCTAKGWAIVSLFSLLLCTVCGPPAEADGVFAEPDYTQRVYGYTGVASTEQKGVVIELPGKREALLLQTTYNGLAGEFAWVVPVPGRPGRQDVFMASGPFMEEVFAASRPEVRTTIRDPKQDLRAKTDMVLPPGGLEMEAAVAGEFAAEVTVHERMDVGDYDVAVLSSTGDRVLVNWLRRHGYRVPPDSADAFGHYVERGWYFVAMRIRSGVADEKPTLQDVAPIGICFDTEKLVFPLYISRAGSRERTAICLAVVAPEPHVCEQWDEVALPERIWHRKGESYASIRRRALETTPGGVLCESRVPPVAAIGLHFRRDSAVVGRDGPWRPETMWATRLWAYPRPQDMVDLSFAAAPNLGVLRTVVERRGVIYYPPLELAAARGDALLRRFGSYLLLALMAAMAYWLISGVALWRRGLPGLRLLGVALSTLALILVLAVGQGSLWSIGVLVALTIGLAVWLPPGLEKASSDLAAPSGRQRLHGALVAACTAWIVWEMTRLLHGSRWELGPWVRRLSWRLDEIGPLEGALMVALAAVMGSWVFLGLRGVGRRAAAVWLPGAAAFLTCIAVGGAALSERPEHLLGAIAWVTAAAAGGLLLTFLLVGGFLGERPRRYVQPLWLAAAAVAVLAGIASVRWLPRAHAGAIGGHSSVDSRLDAPLEKIDDYLLRFREANGCYPAKLEDLLGSGIPKQGVDSSGNPVEVIRAQSKGASAELCNPLGDGTQPLTALPVDPLTGKTDTWQYEPTGTPMVDSGGYEIRITQQ